ncbi:hypothetical protein ACLOJK_027868 [Asimina triloba]
MPYPRPRLRPHQKGPCLRSGHVRYLLLPSEGRHLIYDDARSQGLILSSLSTLKVATSSKNTLATKATFALVRQPQKAIVSPKTTPVDIIASTPTSWSQKNVSIAAPRTTHPTSEVTPPQHPMTLLFGCSEAMSPRCLQSLFSLLQGRVALTIHCRHCLLARSKVAFPYSYLLNIRDATFLLALRLNFLSICHCSSACIRGHVSSISVVAPWPTPRSRLFSVCRCFSAHFKVVSPSTSVVIIAFQLALRLRLLSVHYCFFLTCLQGHTPQHPMILLSSLLRGRVSSTSVAALQLASKAASSKASITTHRLALRSRLLNI